jgi:hypothetical protein
VLILTLSKPQYFWTLWWCEITPAFCSGVMFRSWLGVRMYWLRCIDVLISSPRRMQIQYLKLTHGRYSPRPCQLISTDYRPIRNWVWWTAVVSLTIP